jgi:hypothetical protein
MSYDTNGYYRELGVLLWATRREIRKAYQAKRGWLSDRLTYIVHQLLDVQVRRDYDETPLGSLFLDDYVQDWMRRERVRNVVALLMQGNLEASEVLKNAPLGWESENLSQRPRSLFDYDYSSEEWPWAYYLWRSDCHDVERLRQWQELLVSVLGERKEHHQLAIGFAGEIESSCEVLTVGYRVCVFLHEDELPTEVLARAAASRVVKHIHQEIKKCQNNLTSDVAQTKQKRLPREPPSPVPSGLGWRTKRLLTFDS